MPTEKPIKSILKKPKKNRIIVEGRPKRSEKAPQKSGTQSFSLWNIWVASAILKVLLFPAYHSTDFDVHRNWLAITNKLPLRDWYVEATSEWTLDYPPFFAYFEWFLSQLVPSIVRDDGCLDIVSNGKYGWPTVVFQRLTVIVSEVVLFWALQHYINTCRLKDRARSFVIASSIVLSPGLLIVDHIHFQYNGMMFGILVLSIVAAKNQHYLRCGSLFAILLCFKHIFLYLAPAYFVFLLRAYCIDPQNRSIHFINWRNLTKLGLSVVSIFVLAFAPFAYYGLLPQLVSRLFPFARGLTHAYWAPNIWALYSFGDRILIKLCTKFPNFSHAVLSRLIPHFRLEKTFERISQMSLSSTRGLVGEVEFAVLPVISPRITFCLTLFYQVLAVGPVLVMPTFERFAASLTLCGFASFLFGYHVHEKAILLVIIPFSFIVTKDRRLLSSFQTLVATGYVSLFPLLFGSAEWLFKVLYTYVWCVIYFSSLSEVTPVTSSPSRRIFYLDRLNLIYIFGLIPLVLLCGFVDLFKAKFDFLAQMEFLNLMMISVYCGIGIVASWNGLSWLYFVDEPLWECDG